jgi:hypothetical protein
MEQKRDDEGFPCTYLMEPTVVHYKSFVYHVHKIKQTVYIVMLNKARDILQL